MILADRLRQHVIENYIKPAREKGRTIVSIRAGDVHKELGLTSRIPAVCGAIDAKKFEEIANIQLRERTGPHQGPNAVWVFRVRK